MDKEVLKRQLTERCQQALDEALRAVDEAPDGQWIAASEWEVRDIFQKLTAVTGKFLEAKVRHMGYVPRDENLHRAIMAQRPVCEMFPASPSARAIAVIAARFMEDKYANDGTGGGGLKLMWQRLFRDSQAVAAG